MSHSRVKPLLPYPALLVDTDLERVLIVADLHIGWEIDLIANGIHIPSQLPKLLTKLQQAIDMCIPDRIIILGDIKQAIPKISIEEWRSVPEFLKTIQESVNDVSIVLGNHDGGLETLTPSSVKIYPASGTTIGNEECIGLFHGHAWPSPDVLRCDVLIMGHIHPLLVFRDEIGSWMAEQVWVKAKCNSRRLARAYLRHLNVPTVDNPEKRLKDRCNIEIKDPNFIIMPTFNELIGGAPINRGNRRLIGPLLRSGSVRSNDAELYLLDGMFVGTVRQVRAQLNADRVIRGKSDG